MSIQPITTIQHFISSKIEPSEGCDLLGNFAMGASFDQISELAKLCFKKLKYSVKGLKPFQIRPLHIATIFENIGAIKAFCLAGANPNQRDYKGYTAYHLASISTNSSVLNTLRKHCLPEDPKVTNIYGATAEQLRTYQRYHQPAVCFEGEQCEDSLRIDEIPSHITFDEACKPNGWIYVNEHVASSADLVTQWLDSNTKSRDVIKFGPPPFRKGWVKFKTAPPKLHVRPQEMLAKNGTSYTQCGLFAAEDIKAGTFISEYKGRFVEDEAKDMLRVYGRPYLFNNIDGEYFRGIGGMVNDGLPNTVATTIESTDGVKGGMALYSIENIEAGNEILFDYGHNYDGKIGPRVEIREKDILKFFSEKDTEGLSGLDRFRNLENKLSNETPTHETELLLTRLQTYIYYILFSPQAIPILLKNNLITRDDLDRMFIRMFVHKAYGNLRGKIPASTSQIGFRVPLAKAYEVLQAYDLRLKTNFAQQFIEIYLNALNDFHIDRNTNMYELAPYAITAQASGIVLEDLKGNLEPQEIERTLKEFKKNLKMNDDIAYTYEYSFQLKDEAMEKINRWQQHYGHA